MIFGSLIIPAKSVIMNILGIGATLGMLTLIFVDGMGADLFNFTPGPLMSPVLVLIIAILFGLSTDYEVFLVSRMVEARARGASTDQAIRFGTATTGSIITAAALIMIVVCGAFGFSSIVMMKYIAFGMVIALILDATVIRMFLVPAVMHLLRDDNWWAPRWVQKLSEKVGHNEQLDGHSAAVPAAVGAGVGAGAGARPESAAETTGSRLRVADLAEAMEHREHRDRKDRREHPDQYDHHAMGGGAGHAGETDASGELIDPSRHERTLPFSELMKRVNDRRDDSGDRHS